MLYFKFLLFTRIFNTYILLVHPILFTTYTISTSYTYIHYTVFDVYVARKKSLQSLLSEFSLFCMMP